MGANFKIPIFDLVVQEERGRSPKRPNYGAVVAAELVRHTNSRAPDPEHPRLIRGRRFRFSNSKFKISRQNHRIWRAKKFEI